MNLALGTPFVSLGMSCRIVRLQLSTRSSCGKAVADRCITVMSNLRFGVLVTYACDSQESYKYERFSLCIEAHPIHAIESSSIATSTHLFLKTCFSRSVSPDLFLLEQIRVFPSRITQRTQRQCATFSSSSPPCSLPALLFATQSLHQFRKTKIMSA